MRHKPKTVGIDNATLIRESINPTNTIQRTLVQGSVITRYPVQTVGSMKVRKIVGVK